MMNDYAALVLIQQGGKKSLERDCKFSTVVKTGKPTRQPAVQGDMKMYRSADKMRKRDASIPKDGVAH
jgi:hypothetical protein